MSRSIRRIAIDALNCMADVDARHRRDRRNLRIMSLGDIVLALGADDWRPATTLARAALDAVLRAQPRQWETITSRQWARRWPWWAREAAAMLLDGWSPEDPR